MLPPYLILGLQIFSPNSIGCILILLFPLLCRSHIVRYSPICLLSLLSLVLLVLYPKKLLPRPMSRSIFSMLSYKSFTVSDLTFTSLIHLKLNFVSGIRRGSDLIYLHVNIWFSQHHLLKRLFPHWVFLTPLLNVSWLYMHAFISRLSIAIPLISVSVSVPVPYCLITVALKFEIGECDASSFAIIFEDCFGYPQSFVVPSKF